MDNSLLHQLRIEYSAALGLWLLANCVFTPFYIANLIKYPRSPFVVGKIGAGLISLIDVAFYWFVIMFEDTNRDVVQWAFRLLPMSVIAQAVFFIWVGWMVFRGKVVTHDDPPPPPKRRVTTKRRGE